MSGLWIRGKFSESGWGWLSGRQSYRIVDFSQRVVAAARHVSHGFGRCSLAYPKSAGLRNHGLAISSFKIEFPT